MSVSKCSTIHSQIKRYGVVLENESKKEERIGAFSAQVLSAPEEGLVIVHLKLATVVLGVWWSRGRAILFKKGILVQLGRIDKAGSARGWFIPVTGVGLDRLKEGSLFPLVIVDEALDPEVTVALELLETLGHVLGLLGLEIVFIGSHGSEELRKGVRKRDGRRLQGASSTFLTYIGIVSRVAKRRISK